MKKEWNNVIRIIAEDKEGQTFTIFCNKVVLSGNHVYCFIGEALVAKWWLSKIDEMPEHIRILKNNWGMK